MNSTSFRHAYLLVTLVLFAICSEASRGDLFALLNSDSGIVRMNSTTGEVIDTYEPFDGLFPGPISISSGLAFDGRNLYINRRLDASTEEVWRFELATETWLPIGILDTTTIGSPAIDLITGLGYLPGEFGEGTLIAVTRRGTSEPSYIVEYPLGPPHFPPLLPTHPIGILPESIRAHGADYDPASGELWISADDLQPTTITAVLLRVDLDGNVLQTLTPAFGVATVPRGLAFDEGRLFVGGRNLPNGSNDIYRIDYTTGAILNTFVFPGEGTLVALAGGTVVPEPTTGVLCLVIAGLVASRIRRTDGRRE